MGVAILRSKDQIRAARAELRRRRIGYERSIPARLLASLGIGSRLALGDRLKSWDVLQTAIFLEQNVSTGGAILDLGAFASEILYVLYRMGYQNLHGIDLNPQLGMMASMIPAKFQVGDFYHTGYDSGKFAAATAISVIEHGYREADLLAEVSRLLAPGGYFVASFDYWPRKVGTEGVDLFGMEWRIFSSAEVSSLVKSAGEVGLEPVGDVNLAVERTVVDWGGRSYSFAWMALRKHPSERIAVAT